MTTMTVSEACYIVFDIVAAELARGRRGHHHHPVSALREYDIVQICTAFNLVVANEFLLAKLTARQDDDFEREFSETMKWYECGPLHVVGPTFVADDEVDALVAKPAFDIDDPRFLSQEPPSSFAKYCKSVGADDPNYWQKIYTRLGLEYTSTSPVGNEPVDTATARQDEELQPRSRPDDKASDQPGPTFSPMVVVMVALLVVLGTISSTRPWLLVVGICNVLLVVHLGGYVVAGSLAGASIEKVELFWNLFGGKSATMRVKNVAISIGWLPLGGSVRFRQSEGPEPAPHDGSFNRLPLAWRLTIHASGLLALFLLVCVCIGAEEAVASIFHGLYQVLAGAMAPLSLGQALVRRAIELPQRGGLVVAFGVLAAKLVANDLIPLGQTSGWQLLTAIVPEQHRESKVFFGMILLGLFCRLGLAVGWGIAICKAAIIAFQGG